MNYVNWNSDVIVKIFPTNDDGYWVGTLDVNLEGLFCLKNAEHIFTDGKKFCQEYPLLPSQIKYVEFINKGDYRGWLEDFEKVR